MLNWRLILTHSAVYSIVGSIYLVILLVIDNRMSRAVEDRAKVCLGERHADGIPQALAEWTGRRLDSGCVAELRMSRSAALPLAEVLEFVEREVIAAQMEKAVEQHRGMAAGEDETVPSRP